MSLESLLTFPGFFIADFLKPRKAPIQTLGMESMQNIDKKRTRVGKGTAAEEFSNQYVKLMMMTIQNTNTG